MDITSRFSPNDLKIHKTWPIVAVIGVIALAIYLWAFLSIIPAILMIGGTVSLLILFFLPALTAYITTNNVIREIKSSKRIMRVRDYVLPSLRQLAALLAIDAVIVIPIVVIFYLYFQLYANAIFKDMVNCTDAACSAFLPGMALQQAPLVLLIAIGLWGVNILACVLPVRLAIRGWDFMETVFGSLFALICVVFAMYELFVSSKFSAWYLILIAALLPYVLAFAIATISPRAPGAIVTKRR